MNSAGLNGDRADDIRELVDNLEQDFVLLNHGSRPSLTRGLSITAGGVLLLLLSLRPKKKKAKQRKNLSSTSADGEKVFQ